MSKLKFGYYNRIKLNKELNDNFLDFIENQSSLNYFGITEGFREFKNCYVAIDEKINRIIGIMFVSKKFQEIYMIESIIKGQNIAMKMINEFDKKYKTKINPYNIVKEAEEFWKKKGYTIDAKTGQPI